MSRELISQVCRQEGMSERELFLHMARKHPKRFTNPDEIAGDWKARIARGESIPYVEQFLLRVSAVPS